MHQLPPTHESKEPAATPPSGWDPKLQTPEARKALVDYAKNHGIKPAMRHFGCSRNTIRKWLRRFDEHGPEGLKGLPRGRRPKTKSAQPAKPTPTVTRFPWPALPNREQPSQDRIQSTSAQPGEERSHHPFSSSQIPPQQGYRSQSTFPNH